MFGYGAPIAMLVYPLVSGTALPSMLPDLFLGGQCWFLGAWGWKTRCGIRHAQMSGLQPTCFIQAKFQLTTWANLKNVKTNAN